MEQPGDDARIGTVAAGKYRILKLLGRGGMGSVYEAQNIAIGKRVALKFVLIGAAADSALRARFHHEARAVSAVESAHIVQIFDTGETEQGEPFLVMELLQGEDLATLLRRRGRLGPVEAVDVVVQALRGLRRAHAAGVVHRDLKPGNLFIVRGEDDQSHVKIVDFGLSKDIGGIGAISASRGSFPERAAITAEGALVGTPLYMSPEQIEALPDVDHRTDIWSMGAILYEALVGAPPFAETSYTRLLLAICQRDPEDVRRLVPAVPEAVAHAVSQALCRDRAKRLSSADEFLRVLLAAMPQLDRAPVARASLSSITDPEGLSPVPSGDLVSVPALEAGQPSPSPSEGSSPNAELRTYTLGGATLWISQSPSFSLWRGEVAAPDRLRIESRDGGLHELRLSPVGVLRLGRAEKVGDEQNDLVYSDVASRLAAILRHDGVRWWLKRRMECSVPVQVGARALARGDEAPLVHGTFVSVGGMRATMVDRRYVTPTVPAGTVDPLTGLLGRAGLEQEVAAFLQRKRPGALVLARALSPAAAGGAAGEYPPVTFGVMAIHRTWPSLVVGCVDGTAVLLSPGNDSEISAVAQRVAEVARAAGAGEFACGSWLLAGEGLDAGREIELALHAIKAYADAASSQGAWGQETSSGASVSLRDIASGARFATTKEVLAASSEAKRVTLLFGIEEQNALSSVGPQVVTALQQELAAVVATHAGSGALVSPLAAGVVAACITRKLDPTVMGNAVQCDWHARPPIMDGKVELPRTLSWEILHGADAVTRAAEISRECSDPHGVLSALSGGLPYPIAGRVHAAIAASSAIERVKMLFDVLEGTWRFIATVLVSAYFAKRVAPQQGAKPGQSAANDPAPGFSQMLDFYRRVGTRDGFALGTWRELARIAAKGFEDRDDPIGALAKDVLGVKLSQNQTFETLSNLMQVERNSFAHGHYNEAKGAADLPEFEQMTRTFLRALRPLCAWTLVTVEKTEPDLYGEVQTVEFIDHTGPFNTGTRRRIGLNSPVRLANVAYLARWREGLVLPLDPLIRRVAHDDKFELFWMDHLPRAGACHMSSSVGNTTVKIPSDVRRLPPLLRMLVEKGSG